MTTTAEDVIRLLPKILEENPNIRYEIYDMLEKKFATKDEIREILKELKASREESNKKFEEMRIESDKKFAESTKRFEEMKSNMNKRFDAVEDGLSNHKKFVDVVVGGVQRRAGRNLEDTVAGALRYALNPMFPSVNN